MTKVLILVLVEVVLWGVNAGCVCFAENEVLILVLVEVVLWDIGELFSEIINEMS